MVIAVEARIARAKTADGVIVALVGDPGASLVAAHQGAPDVSLSDEDGDTRSRDRSRIDPSVPAPVDPRTPVRCIGRGIERASVGACVARCRVDLRHGHGAFTGHTENQ